MSLSRYTDAASAFRTGLGAATAAAQKGGGGDGDVDGEVVRDMKRKYAEAVRMAGGKEGKEGTGDKEEGKEKEKEEDVVMPKRVMAILHQMRARSWNVRDFATTQSTPLTFPPLATVFSRTAPTTPTTPAPFALVSNPPTPLQHTLARAMRAKFPSFVLDTAPVTYWHREMEERQGKGHVGHVGGKEVDPKAPESHLLLHHPLITGVWLWHLCKLAGAGVPTGRPGPAGAGEGGGKKKTKKPADPSVPPDWHLVFSLNFRPPPPMARVLTPVYAAVVDRANGVVLDFVSWIVGVPDGGLFMHAVAGAVAGQGQGQQAGPQGEQESVWHTAESLGEVLELIEEVYGEW
ncbi:hypothetical protein HDU93_004362 [Gonapodya sp. JEL0774]|nr:hypothetical protein HDU93_004362 [Gonapodya sp. JEL0774]